MDSDLRSRARLIPRACIWTSSFLCVSQQQVGSRPSPMVVHFPRWWTNTSAVFLLRTRLRNSCTRRRRSISPLLPRTVRRTAWVLVALAPNLGVKFLTPVPLSSPFPTCLAGLNGVLSFPLAHFHLVGLLTF